MSEIAAHSDLSPPRPAGRSQWIKWAVYILLLCNGFFYVFEETQIAAHTLREGGSLFQWTQAYTTTIDNLAWYGLLLAFELETYALDDKAFERPWVSWALHGLRLVCYVLLIHTLVALVDTMDQAWSAPARPDVTSLCQLADQDISWGYNYDYTVITSDNCAALGNGPMFYMIEKTVVTDSAGWIMEKRQSLAGLISAVFWLLVIGSIELVVWLQNRNISSGPIMLASFAVKGCYALLFALAGFWLYTGHYVYAWDQTLWILGFWAIERNLSAWREEIREASREKSVSEAGKTLTAQDE